MNQNDIIRRKGIHLILIMVLVSMAVGGVSIAFLYRTTMDGQTARLVETALSRARMIEAVARFDKKYNDRPVTGGAYTATLGQIREAHKNFRGFGKTGEFTLAKRDGDQIVFLLSHRHRKVTSPAPVSFSSDLAEPMRAALEGRSGTMVGLDYRGEKVLAAFEPVKELDLGIVAKIDLIEVQTPFITAALSALAISVLFIVAGGLLFKRTGRPIIKHLEKSEAKYSEIVETAQEGVWIISSSGQTSFTNQRMAEILGYLPDEMLDRSVLDFMDESAQAEAIIKLNRRREGISEIHEFCFRHKDGRDVWTSIAANPLYDENGNFSGSLGMISDITERKQAEQQLIAAKQEAERANRAKSDFLSRMSHELRTPLNAILGFSQLMRLDEQRMDEEQQEAVEHIFEAGEHLLYLINEILDIARIDAEKMALSIEDVPLETVFNSTLMLVRNLALAKGVTIRELPVEIPWVHADIKRLKQIMVNLLSNAIKYNSKGGKVTITFPSALEGRVRINITDTGIGIKPGDQAAVFDPFYRVALKGETVEGTGIGLSVVKKLVETMDGHIGVKSEYGQGSTFWIELPQAQPIAMKLAEEDIAALSVAAIDIGRSTQRILYVEDNPANLDLMRLIFKKLPNYELLSAPNAEQGLDIAREQHPDLILMDLDLPGMDGFEALEKLHTNCETADIPVIAVSAHAMPEHIAKGTKAGFIDYVTKPIQVDQLITTMKRAF